MMDDTKTNIQRFSPDYLTGLNDAEVSLRYQQGLSNGETEIKTKTVGQIVRDNVITPFNILNFILAALILMVGSYKNLLFMGVILSNIFIGCIQEIRAKKTIDKLSLIAAPKAKVIRNGQQINVSISEIVLDDIMILSAGNQICSDCVIINGECEVNESLLTGESDAIEKKVGDTLLSGSFLASGNCYAQVEQIGKENYAAKISSSAKYLKKPNSEIMFWINKIIKLIGFGIIPIGLLLFYKQIFISGQPFNRAIVSTVAALIGMIPEGIVLLTSVVLAVSVIRLSQHKTLVQELYCIETLARVDMLCLDKTGTITEGTMQVDGVTPLGNLTEEEIDHAISALVHSLQDSNPTFNALKNAYAHVNVPNWDCEEIIAFSSARKWSGAYFNGMGSFVIGAAEFILKDEFELLRPQIEKHSKNGQRVLLLAYSPDKFVEKELATGITPLALILLSDKIRPEARQTLEYFADQGVDIKVISGDNAVTVANIAKKAGLKQADNYVDATTLKSEEDIIEAVKKYSIFGRVTPQQKLDIVKALKADGHTVAMTGDGVNDVLALKESDCSIAMASGSDAARTVSQLVLLDSNFASMPKVVQEGRRSINNLQRSASLFLVKTIFSAIIGVCFIFLPCDYPFQPIQFTLINALTIGIPSFILALEPNKERIKGKFIINVIRKALPGALTMAINVLLLVAVSKFMNFNNEQLSTLAVILTGYTGLLILFKVCIPFNYVHSILFCTMSAGFVIAFLFFKSLFSLINLSFNMIFVIIPLLLLSTCFIIVATHLIERVIMKNNKH